LSELLLVFFFFPTSWLCNMHSVVVKVNLLETLETTNMMLSLMSDLETMQNHTG
jgi:hypothetical protein